MAVVAIEFEMNLDKNCSDSGNVDSPFPDYGCRLSFSITQPVGVLFCNRYLMNNNINGAIIRVAFESNLFVPISEL